ncbi:MAG: 2-oxoacid:acceptor oxidoreductase family protein, partial [Deltaproteobacteria bacterium]|nr:2-oxoacid:acceptor oxidoreductase family protein [Deltaproteobacteria bacterium]
RFAQGFPSFGPERRGAPVAAFNRVDEKRIKRRCVIASPDVVVVLDESLIGLVNVTDGLKPDGMLVVNTSKKATDIKKALNYKGKLATVDASAIALEEMGTPITNTTMLGALIKATKIVKLASVAAPLEHRFGRIAARNQKSMQRAYDEVKID